MGISDNSHGKIDKGTQSPLLKIFKEIMTREKDDPEKRNLLNIPREEKKRRQYSGSKNKVDRRSCESSGSEHRKRGTTYKIASSEQRTEFNRSQTIPYQNETKDSWWCWQNTPPEKTENTCSSCVSCALKKIVGSEYACIGCLLLLFTISIIVAFIVVFKNVPNIGGDCKVLDCKDCKESTTGSTTPRCKECNGVADSERLKRKIEMLSNKRLKKGFIGYNEFRKDDDKGDDDDVLSGHTGNPGLNGIDFGPSFRELNSLEPEHRQTTEIDLPNVLNSDNMNLQSNEKLRDFYRKLAQTDAKIKSLKKINQDESYDEIVHKSPDRSRRSLKLYHYPKRYRVLRRRRSFYGKHQKVNETSVAKTKSGNKTRLKRFNSDEEPTGFIIEKKKVLVQYKPAGKRPLGLVKKCQHTPAGTHTYEKQMKHPFYKNTHRLDMLLDNFLNKNIPELISDPFGIDELFKEEKPNKHCKHPKPKYKNVNFDADEQILNQLPKFKFNRNNKESRIIGSGMKPEFFKMSSSDLTTQYGREFFNHEAKMIGKQKKKLVTDNPNDFEVMMSVSTIMNPDSQKMTRRPPPLRYEGSKLNRVPNIRKLMQVEAGEDEENFGYEDVKEVLTDEMDNHDEVEKSIDRKRRDNEQPEPLQFRKFYPPSSVYNPNWKGAMPLYPDEILYKADDPKPTDQLPDHLASQRKIRDLSDVEYVEDYLENKYTRLVQQAQAYSDYGVLDGKKESRNEKESPTADSATDHKIKLSADENLNKPGQLRRLKRDNFVKGSMPRQSDVIKKNSQYVSEIEITTPGSPAQTGMDTNYLKLKAEQLKPLKPQKAKSESELDPSYEGIRVEMLPTTRAREDMAINNFDTIMKMISKHVKIRPKNLYDNIEPLEIYSNLVATRPGVEFSTARTTVLKTLDELEREKGLFFAMTNGHRRLLSTGFKSSGNFGGYKSSLQYRRGKTESNRSSPDPFFYKFNMNKNLNLTDETALNNYINEITEMNIKHYSTPIPASYVNRLVSEATRNISEENIPITEPTEVGKDSIELVKVDAELPDPEATINNSLVRVNTGDSFFGKILITVNDPEYGVKNFNLIFDVPIIMNLNEELMMLDDRPVNLNVLNQFEKSNDVTVDPQNLDIMDYFPDHGPEEFIQNEIIPKRVKRDTSVTATWSDDTKTAEYTKKDSNVTVHLSEPRIEVSIKPCVASSTISAAPAVTPEQINRPSSSTSTPKTARDTNATGAIDDNLSLSEFFGVVANWFRTLEYGNQDKPTGVSSGSGLNDMLLTINSNNTNQTTGSSTDESAYPLYDSDMIENIGHRSRVLLSAEDDVTNVTETNQVVNSTNATVVTAASTAAEGNGRTTRTTNTTLTTDLRSNVITTTTTNPVNKTSPTTKKDDKIKLKAIVKRNADGSNLIFWNDIYDDEYGIQRDKLDDAVRDKHSVKHKDFIERSGRWVKNKIKKFAMNLKINPHSNDAPSVHSDNMETKERVPRSIGHNNMNPDLAALPHRYYRDRDVEQVVRKNKDDSDKIEEDYLDIDQKSLFAAMSVTMKEVCKKAAKAVQYTRSLDRVPDNLLASGGAVDESKHGSIANALMQELVRLLTDLVDYQVQQKTCTKLPGELQSFLEWLTSPKEEKEELFKQTEPLFKAPNHADEELMDDFQVGQEEQLEFPDALRMRGIQYLATDEKARYEEDLHSIQDLLEQYDKMTDEEKGTLLRVKYYLEKQLAFLQQQLSAYDIYTFLEKRDIPRNKRDVYIIKQQTPKQRPRRRPHKFNRNYGKKHTRTTAGYNDESQLTETVMNRRTVENKESLHPTSDINVHQKMRKRNLKDVYYRAIAEAKKFSLAKINHEKDEGSRFETSTAMGKK